MNETQAERLTRLGVTLVRIDGRLERHCEHGIGHPVGHRDPANMQAAQDWFWVHGCDGCCKDWPRDQPTVPKPSSIAHFASGLQLDDED